MANFEIATTDRRGSERFPADTLTYITARGESRRRSRLLNLSAGGASISWDYPPIHRGRRVKLFFIVADGNVVKTVSSTAEVIRCSEDQLGLRLLPPSSTMRLVPWAGA